MQCGIKKNGRRFRFFLLKYIRYQMMSVTPSSCESNEVADEVYVVLNSHFYLNMKSQYSYFSFETTYLLSVLFLRYFT